MSKYGNVAPRDRRTVPAPVWRDTYGQTMIGPARVPWDSIYAMDQASFELWVEMNAFDPEDEFEVVYY